VYRRAIDAQLSSRLRAGRSFIQVVMGPRQVGKTTSVLAVLDELPFESHYASADSPATQSVTWLAQQWETARASAAGGPRVLVLDEVQKIPRWSEQVKALWDEDTRSDTDLRVAVLWSSPMLMQAGLSESLAGRFEVLRWTHWMFGECRDAFGWDLETFLYFGGYPGAAPLVDDVERWRSYIVDSLIETTLSRDVLLMTRVDKPALLRQLFSLAVEYSGQVLSYNKMLGQLLDAGNTTTLAHYLTLLEGAGLVTGLPKYSATALRRRGSSPKLQVMNTALMTALSGRSPADARSDSAWHGRLVESAVGAALLAQTAGTAARVGYWREGTKEVDFVVETDTDIFAIEVKSGRAALTHDGTGAFLKTQPKARPVLVGGDGVKLERVLAGDLDLGAR
jgi:predicted AAA+ superfamily ATPase